MDQSHHVPRLSRGPLVALISAGLVLGVLLARSQAQVRTAITPDGTLGTAVTQSGTVYSITGGTRPGNGPNLFHSFDRFSVGTNDTASFSGPTGIVNILSRVTRGQQSVIDGQLQSTIPGANLYLLNPRGVFFGPHATLDVSGSFHVSTANYLRLADGATFSTHLGEKTTLTVAPPVAFGFLSQQPAPITIQGSTLQVSKGQGLSVVGGDMQIVGGTLKAPSGRIQLASVASPGEVIFSPLELASDLQVDSFARLGRLELSQGALLDASGDSGGTVLIRGGRLLLDGSSIFANTLGDVDGTHVGLDLRLADDIVITNGGAMTADSLGAGRAGDLRMTARSVEMADGSFVGSTAYASGDSGDVTLNVGKLTLTRAATLGTDTFGAGRAGLVMVTATDSVAILGERKDGLHSLLFSTAESESSGDAGRIVVSAPLLTIDDAGIAGATAGSGQAGDIVLTVGKLTLTNGAQIGSGTFGVGNGGTVTVVATDSVSISGIGQDGNRAGLFSTAEPGSSGDAGKIVVSAPVLRMENDGNISASTKSSGRAGEISVNVRNLTLTGGAKIGSSTFSSGPGGKVSVSVTDSAIISGRDSDGSPSGLFSLTSSSGPGGNLHLQAARIQLTDGAVITASSAGAGDAGNIVIQAGRLFQVRNSSVTTEAETADGGNITLTAGSLVDLRDSQITATVESGVGKGGNITIDPRFVILDRSQIRADAFGGPGGKVRLVAEVFLADPESRVSASSARSIQGTVDIQASVTNLREILAPLSPDFARATELLRDRCAARLREGTVSSFVVRGRPSPPATYDGLLPSRLYEPQRQQTTPAGAGQPPVEPPAAPQGLRRVDPAGRVQGTYASAFPVPPLGLELSCAR